MKFMRTDAQYSWVNKIVLGSLIPLLCLALYLGGSYARHQEDPDDKVMPSPSQIVQGLKWIALDKDRDGVVRLWVDTWASMKRFVIALMFIALAIIVGVNMGVFPFWEHTLKWFVIAFGYLPPLAILPILFIVLKTGEVSKVALIFIGGFPTIALDAYLKAKAVPREQIHKAQSYGATEQEICYRIILPQIFPAMLDALRLNFRTAMTLLIAAEGLAAAQGLGYRIFLFQRHMSMNMIMSYLVWMGLLLLAADYGVQYLVSRVKWLNKE